MLDRYVIVERIAVGGMGEVFVARQEGVGNFRRTVVLKKLLPDAEGDDEAVTRLLDEARINAALSHENVVSIIEVGTGESDKGVLPWMALEYVHGENCGTLRTRAGKRGLAIPVVVAAQIVKDSARGLQHAHNANDVDGRPLRIIHRDIAPKNIFVRVDGVSKVGDFGVARADARLSHTATGAIAGTLTYMSPEQLSASKELTARSDQFALGVVFWELLTGRRLFKAEGPVEVAEKIMNGKIRAPSKYRDDVPAAVDAIVLRMLQRDPARRFPDCGEVALAIDAAVKDVTAVGRDAVAGFVEDMAGPELRERQRRIEEGAEQTTRGDRGVWGDNETNSSKKETRSQSRADTKGDPTVRERGSATANSAPSTKASLALATATAPPKKSKAWAAIAALVVVVAAVCVFVFAVPREPDLNARTLAHLQQAAKVRPLTFREAVVDDALAWDIADKDAEALAAYLTALMQQRFALLVAQRQKTVEQQEKTRLDLVAKDQALIQLVRTALKPWGDAEFRARILRVWQYDSAEPITFAPPLTPEQIQKRVYPNGVAHMKDTRAQRWSQVERLALRAKADPKRVEAALRPLVERREVLLEQYGTAPMSMLVQIERDMKALKASGALALQGVVDDKGFVAAIVSVAFIGMPDTEAGEAQIDEKALVVDEG